MLAPITIVRAEQSLVLQSGQPARVEINHAGAVEIVIERTILGFTPASNTDFAALYLLLSR
jgi:hypothetical protein